MPTDVAHRWFSATGILAVLLMPAAAPAEEIRVTVDPYGVEVFSNLPRDSISVASRENSRGAAPHSGGLGSGESPGRLGALGQLTQGTEADGGGAGENHHMPSPGKLFLDGD